MNDPYPTTIDIAIDRDRLRTYLRVKYLILAVLPITLLGFVMGFGRACTMLEHSHRDFGANVPFVIDTVVRTSGTLFILSILAYFIFGYFTIARYVSSLVVSVEGPFLRIRQNAFHLSDRKLHFRSIVDYTTIQGRLMRAFGIEGLQMTTMAGGPYYSIILILGIKDCLKIRDLLSEVDRLRENQ